MHQRIGVFTWTLLAMTALVAGSGAAPAGALDLEASKVRMVERFGLSAADPKVADRIAGANAVQHVTVTEDATGVSIVVEMTGTPEHRGVIFAERRRYVLDLFNSLNVADGGPWDLGPDSPIRAVRHSQFQVQPDYISRIVCDLAPGVEPVLTPEAGRITIFVPSAHTAPVVFAHAPDTILSHDMTVTDVPSPGPVVLDGFAEADVEPAAAADAPPAAPAPQSGDETAIAVTPWWMAMDDLQETPAATAAGTAGTTPPSATKEFVADVEPMDPTPEPRPVVAAELEPAPMPQAETPWWVVEDPESDPATAADDLFSGLDTMAVEPVAMAPDADAARVDIALAEPVDEPLVEELDDEPIAAPMEDAPAPPVMDEPAAEPARTEVTEPVDTPSMPALPEPDLPLIEPVIIAEPAPVETVLAELEPLLPEPEPLVPEPVFPTNPAPVMVAADAGLDTRGAVGLDPMQQTVTLTFREADLNAVLDIIARKGRINILAGRDVSGSVTVRLTDVPLDVALDAVLNVNGYGYIQTHNIYRIVPLSQIGGDEVETVTETFSLSYAQAKDVATTLESFLTRNGSLNTDVRTNLLIVTDVPRAVERIANLIPQIDRRVKQVMIEVVILDSVLEDNGDLGVTWNFFQADDRTPNVNSLGTPFATGGTLFGAGGTATTGTSFQDGLGVVLPSAASGGAGLRLRFGTLIGDFNLGAFIEAQVVNSDARVLANPKLLTLDNSEASIDIIEEIPFSDITQTSSGGQLSNISFKEVGTKLKVTPHITNDGYVILEIKPEQSSRIAQTATGVPIIASRRAETTLLVQDRQTIVLGGLRVNASSLSRTKVPGLGDVPAVKLLFRSTSTRERDTEILVFLTTNIVESPPIRPHERLVYDEISNWPRRPEASSDLWR